MDQKFLRVFAYGMVEGETLIVDVEGEPVTFTFDHPQVDVPVRPSVEAAVVQPLN